MSRVGAPRLRPRRPFVCVVCVGRVVCVGGALVLAWGVLCVLGVLRVAWEDFVCGFWTGLGVLWCWLWCGWGLCRDSVPKFLRVLGWLVGALGWLGAGLGSVGGIATIGAALRRVAGVSGVYGRKIPRVVAWMGQRRVPFRWQCWRCSTSLSICPGGVARLCWWFGGNCYHRRWFAACRRRVGGLWSQNPPSACSKCSPPRWYAGDMGCLGCSGLRFGRVGSW